MATSLKIRNSGIYRLLLFAVCVVAFGQVLLGLRSLQFRVGYGEQDLTDFQVSEFGAGGEIRRSVEQLSGLYVSEELTDVEPDFAYFISGRRGTYTNREHGEDIFAAFPYAVRIDGNTVRYGTAFKAGTDLQIPAQDYPDMVIGIPSKTMDWLQSRFDRMSQALTWHPVRYLAALLVLFAGTTELLLITGRQADGGVRLLAIDRWPTELLAAAGVIAGFLFIRFFTMWMAESMNVYAYGNESYRLLYYVPVFLFALLLAMLLVAVRKGKAGRILKDAILYRLGSASLDALRGDAENLARTEQSFRIALRYVVVSVVLVILWRVRFFGDVVAMVLLLTSGVIFLHLLRTGIRVSEESVRASLEEQLKAERLKVDLVTNVSHDLNTPLTSIIGYADLLQDEEMSEAASEYVEILRKKSLRLKGIVSDLFDLSKSTSGAIDVQRETLDYTVLVRQTLSDLADSIRAGNREVVAKLPDEPVWVCADGLQLYRVIQNLIDNAVRYSLEGTRIFVRLEANGDAAHLTVKNTSAYPLDFDEEEILSRFVRGDLARTTEGSGLGLAIARSFTENNDGGFQIFAEEDTFIAMQTLRIAGCPQDAQEDKNNPR